MIVRLKFSFDHCIFIYFGICFAFVVNISLGLYESFIKISNLKFNF